MPKAPRAATFKELLQRAEPGVAAIARQLKKRILEVDGDAVETVRLGDNAATFGVGPRKMIDGYVYVMPMRESVNLGFYQGALLEDSDGLLEGTGKALRHVKIRSLKEADRAGVLALISAAVSLRR